MNKEINNFPLIMSDIDNTISELATINQFEPVNADDVEDDLLEVILEGENQ